MTTPNPIQALIYMVERRYEQEADPSLAIFEDTFKYAVFALANIGGPWRDRYLNMAVNILAMESDNSLLDSVTLPGAAYRMMDDPPEWPEILNEQREVFPTPEPPTLEEAKVRAEREIDLAAERIRSKYISPGTGKMGTYMQKNEEAKDLMRDVAQGKEPNLDKYPIIKAEAEYGLRTPLQIAQDILETAELWYMITAQIEGLQMVSKQTMREMETVEEVLAFPATIDWTTVLPDMPPEESSPPDDDPEPEDPPETEPPSEE